MNSAPGDNLLGIVLNTELACSKVQSILKTLVQSSLTNHNETNKKNQARKEAGGEEKNKSLPSGSSRLYTAVSGKQSFIPFSNSPLKNLCCKAGWQPRRKRAGFCLKLLAIKIFHQVNFLVLQQMFLPSNALGGCQHCIWTPKSCSCVRAVLTAPQLAALHLQC